MSRLAGWFLADEDDSDVGLQLRQDAANTALLHTLAPGIPTYQASVELTYTFKIATYSAVIHDPSHFLLCFQGGSRNRYTGIFAGSTDIKGLDFYIAACAPHCTEWGSKQLLRGSYDYLRNARNNHMPGPTWLYTQAFDDSWNSWDGRDRQPNAAELAVSLMSVVAAGAKGLMMFESEVGVIYHYDPKIIFLLDVIHLQPS